MCSEFQLKTKSKDIEAALGVPVRNRSGVIVWDQTVKMFTEAPVLQQGEDGPELVTKVFPTSPFPNSRLSGFENQTDGNDESADTDEKQIKRIYDKPRWKTAFAEHPCLVPMTSFTEFAYWGEKAGQALAFAVPDDEVFFAAAIGIKPFKPKTEKMNGFSLLTHTATQQMLEYHQRLIVLLKPKQALEYLDKMTPEERFNFLIKNRYTGQLDVSKLRTMAKGWEKRAPVQEAKLRREKNYRQVLKAEHVSG